MIKTLVKTQQSALRDFLRQRSTGRAEFNSPLFYKQRVRQCQNTINNDRFKRALPKLKYVCLCVEVCLITQCHRMFIKLKQKHMTASFQLLCSTGQAGVTAQKRKSNNRTRFENVDGESLNFQQLSAAAPFSLSLSRWEGGRVCWVLVLG